MFVHLIALAKLGEKSLAYHYASQSKSDILAKQQSLSEVVKSLQGVASIHVLKTESASFESVQQMDPYFIGVSVYEDMPDFANDVQTAMQLTATDVAAYLIRKNVTQAFSLQKTLYYLYADYLVEYGARFFKARFLAFEHGPVDYDVFTQNRYDRDTLEQQYGFEDKLMFAKGKDSETIYQFVDSRIQKYADFFNSSRWDQKENPTHRSGTPWSIARQKKSRDSQINDVDILKFHHIESL